MKHLKDKRENSIVEESVQAYGYLPSLEFTADGVVGGVGKTGLFAALLLGL